jgi:hypothetical protein
MIVNQQHTRLDWIIIKLKSLILYAVQHTNLINLMDYRVYSILLQCNKWDDSLSILAPFFLQYYGYSKSVFRFFIGIHLTIFSNSWDFFVLLKSYEMPFKNTNFYFSNKISPFLLNYCRFFWINIKIQMSFWINFVNLG